MPFIQKSKTILFISLLSLSSGSLQASDLNEEDNTPFQTKEEVSKFKTKWEKTKKELSGCQLNDKPSVILIGGKNAGKTVFLTYMQGKEIKKMEESNEAYTMAKLLPYPPISVRGIIPTKEPYCFVDKYEDEKINKEITYVDTPGFMQNYNKRNISEHLRRTLIIQNLTQQSKVRALILVIDFQNFINAGEQIRELAQIWENLLKEEKGRTLFIFTKMKLGTSKAYFVKILKNVNKNAKGSLKSLITHMLTSPNDIYLYSPLSEKNINKKEPSSYKEILRFFRKGTLHKSEFSGFAGSDELKGDMIDLLGKWTTLLKKHRQITLELKKEEKAITKINEQIEKLKNQTSDPKEKILIKQLEEQRCTYLRILIKDKDNHLITSEKLHSSLKEITQQLAIKEDLFEIIDDEFKGRIATPFFKAYEAYEKYKKTGTYDVAPKPIIKPNLEEEKDNDDSSSVKNPKNLNIKKQPTLSLETLFREIAQADWTKEDNPWDSIKIKWEKLMTKNNKSTLKLKKDSLLSSKDYKTTYNVRTMIHQQLKDIIKIGNLTNLVQLVTFYDLNAKEMFKVTFDNSNDNLLIYAIIYHQKNIIEYLLEGNFMDVNLSRKQNNYNSNIKKIDDYTPLDFIYDQMKNLKETDPTWKNYAVMWDYLVTQQGKFNKNAAFLRGNVPNKPQQKPPSSLGKRPSLFSLFVYIGGPIIFVTFVLLLPASWHTFYRWMRQTQPIKNPTKAI